MIGLILFSLAGFTQRFNGGLLLGGDISQIDGDDNQGYHKIGWLGGAFVSLKVSEHSSFQLEMEYIQKGARKNADSNSAQVSTSLDRLHYLEVPLLYQFTFAKFLQAEAGPVMDVFLGSYNEMNGSEVPYLTVPYQPVTLAGIVGFSSFIGQHFKASLRFNYSLMSIRTGHVGGERKILFEYGQYNNVLSLSFSYYFKPRDY